MYEGDKISRIRKWLIGNSIVYYNNCGETMFEDKTISILESFKLLYSIRVEMFSSDYLMHQ